MTHEQAAGGRSAADGEITNLSVHFTNGGEADFGVIRHTREAFGGPGIGVFHVRHVDIDQAVEQSEDFGRFVAAAVVNYGQAQAVGTGRFDGGGNRRNDVRRSNEIDVRAADILEAEHFTGQLFDTDRYAAGVVADIVVLAEDARQIAAGKEYRARTAVAHEDAFFAKMRANGTNEQFGGHAAGPFFPCDSVNTAAARTEAACAHLPVQFLDSRAQGDSFSRSIIHPDTISQRLYCWRRL